MPVTRPNTQLHGRRSLAIVALLLTSLILIGILGWQSWTLQKSNAATAESVLRDYATLAADEYTRRSLAAIGYRGYYRIAAEIDESLTARVMLDVIRQNADLRDAAELVEGYFVYGQEGFSTADLEINEEISALVRGEWNRASEPEGVYRSARTASGRQQIVFKITAAGDGARRLSGFTVNASAIGRILQRVFERAPLLPASLGGGNIGNNLLFARFDDPAGQTMFETNTRYDSELTVTRTIGDDYQGVLEGFAIAVSVDPESASTLIIGGLPKSRLPFLLGVMVMTTLLMLIAIWMHRREHAVMALRADFIAQVSHELRTPLTQIRMFAETLLLERTRTQKERRRSLEIIDRESRRLSHLVDNILRFSNVADATLIDCQCQALAPVIQEICDSMRLTANGSTINLVVDNKVQAKVDSDALRQIVLNLLDNAIKFGPADKSVAVSVSGDDRSATITVTDQGPGIPAAERERVWAAFYRMQREEDAAISGTGIGLSVVRELVEAMQGRCWIDGHNGGTRVNIEFPIVADAGRMVDV